MSIESFEIVSDESENHGKFNYFRLPPRRRRVVKNDASWVGQRSAVFFNQRSAKKKSYRRNLKNGYHFYAAIKPIITIGQYFGVFPISFVKSSTPEKMIFKLKSFRTIYSCAVALNLLIALYCIVFHIIKQKKEILSSKIPFAISIGLSFSMIVVFIYRSRMWIILQIKWKKVEETLDMFYSKSRNLRFKFQIIYVVIQIFDLGDFILANIVRVNNKTGFIEFFTFRGKFIIEPLFGSNIIFFDNWLIGILGFYFLIVLIIVVFIKTFTNVFIIFVAIGLTEKYKAINEYVSDIIKSNHQSINWSQLKLHYEMLSDLVRETDRIISTLILLLISGNIYTICVYLFDGLVPKYDGILSEIYFFGGFVLVVIKTFAVILFAAQLHDESKKPIFLLSKCPVQGLTFEPQWLQVQLSIDEVALTAMNFFPVTRKFLITVITNIISYEIILLQFHK